MPAEPLFNISNVDLKATVADRAAIGRLNAHRGAMAQIDRIVWHDPGFDFAVAARRVLHDEFWVDGHIPGRPLMPGVLMVEAAAQVASWMYYSKVETNAFAGFTRIDDTVFRDQVAPGDQLLILTKSIKFSPKRFVCRAQGLVEGAIVFDTTVTGMVFTKVPKQPGQDAAGDPGRAERRDVSADVSR